MSAKRDRSEKPVPPLNSAPAPDKYVLKYHLVNCCYINAAGKGDGKRLESLERSTCNANKESCEVSTKQPIEIHKVNISKPVMYSGSTVARKK